MVPGPPIAGNFTKDSINQKEPVVPLVRLLEGETGPLKVFTEHLGRHGWCFVKMGRHTKHMRDAIGELEHFFARPAEEKQKRKGYEAIRGADNTVIKEKITLVTSNPSLADDTLEDLANLLQALLERLCRVVVPHLFHIPSSLGSEIPLVSEVVSLREALFDVAVYHNNGLDGPMMSIPCASHFDPGLLALSVYSSAPGLQMRCRNGSWVDVPYGSDIGVVWAGHVANRCSGSMVRNGIHRVIPFESKLRMTFWIEASSKNQLDQFKKSSKRDVAESPMHFSTPKPFYHSKGDEDVHVLNVFPHLDEDILGEVTLPEDWRSRIKMEARFGVPLPKDMIHLLGISDSIGSVSTPRPGPLHTMAPQLYDRIKRYWDFK